MAEVAFEGLFDDGRNDEWGLDGWTERKSFKLMITSEDTGGLAYLDIEQCSRLAATLLEHVKEVKDATEENPS